MGRPAVGGLRPRILARVEGCRPARSMEAGELWNPPESPQGWSGSGVGARLQHIYEPASDPSCTLDGYTRSVAGRIQPWRPPPIPPNTCGQRHSLCMAAQAGLGGADDWRIEHLLLASLSG